MAIIDHWSRLMQRKSGASMTASSSSSSGELSAPTSPLDNSMLSLPTSPSPTLSKVTLIWRSTKRSILEQRQRQQEQEHPQYQPQLQQRLHEPSSQGSPERIQPSLWKRKDTKMKTKKKVHPSERPLTDLNLRHQELFANFTFDSPSSSSRASSFGGVSPCSSRQASFDGGRPSPRTITAGAVPQVG